MNALDFEDILEYLEPLRPFLTSDTITEVMINADLSVFVEEAGRKRKVVACGLKCADVAAAVKRIARADNTEPGEGNPIINVRLGDGSSRVCIAMPPVSPDGISIAIRRFRPHPFTAEELIAAGSLPRHVYECLVAAIQKSNNVLISGGIGSGKTTLLNVLAREVPITERICLLEYPPEIQIQHENKVRLAASEDVDFAALIKHAVLRMAPDRIILGEVRAEEAFDLLRALNLGLRGSFATIHADSAEEALYTMASLATSSKPNLNPTFIREQVARAIHYVVHIEKNDGKRAVQEVIRVENKYDAVAHQFRFEPLYWKARISHEEEGR